MYGDVTLENSGTIANNGTLTIKQGGTLTGGTVTGAAVIYEVTGVMLSKTSTTLTVSGTETLTATVLPEGAGNRAVTWSSDHTTVAAVDANGRITAVAERAPPPSPSPRRTAATPPPAP